jgi:hypothetical protein
MKLKDIVTIQTGLLKGRKKGNDSEKSEERYVLSLKSVRDNGELASEFLTKDTYVDLDEKYVTKENDIIVKTFEPFSALYIHENQVGLVIPSYFIILRNPIEDFSAMYIKEFLNTNIGRSQLYKRSTSTTMKTIKAKDLKEVDILKKDSCRQDAQVYLAYLLRIEIAILDKLLASKKKSANIILNQVFSGGSHE